MPHPPSTPAARTARAPRARRPDARPAELLEAALDLFVEKGYAATRVEQVAARAGVSKGTLFLYFASKEELFQAVVRENLASRFSGWNAEFENFEGSASAMLRHCLQTWWRHVGATKASGITKLIMSEAHNFPEIASYYQSEVVDPGTALIQRILRHGIASGEFRDVDTAYATYSVSSTIFYLITWKHAKEACARSVGPFVPEHYIDSQVDILLNGLCQVRAA